MNATFGLNYSDKYSNEVQHQINANVLKYLMNLAVNDKSYFQTKAIANKHLMRFADSFLIKVKKDALKMNTYMLQYQSMIKQFYQHPEKFKIESSPKIPDGSPIGMGLSSYNSN